MTNGGAHGENSSLFTSRSLRDGANGKDLVSTRSLNDAFHGDAITLSGTAFALLMAGVPPGCVCTYRAGKADPRVSLSGE